MLDFLLWWLFCPNFYLRLCKIFEESTCEAINLSSCSLVSFRGLIRWEKRSLFFFPFYGRRFSLSPPFAVHSANRPVDRKRPATLLSSLSIRADSVELPSSKVRASNEAINKSTALTGLSTLFVRDVSIEFFSCLRVREVGPISSILVESSSPTL